MPPTERAVRPTPSLAAARRPHLVLALVAWLLLALQAPWHTGMAGGSALASPGELAAAMGLHCGAQPDAATLRQLAADGYLVDATPVDDTAPSLCDLFATLLAPANAPPPLVLPDTIAATPATAGTTPASFAHVRQTPPARGPPAAA